MDEIELLLRDIFRQNPKPLRIYVDNGQIVMRLVFASQPRQYSRGRTFSQAVLHRATGAGGRYMSPHPLDQLVVDLATRLGGFDLSLIDHPLRWRVEWGSGSRKLSSTAGGLAEVLQDVLDGNADCHHNPDCWKPLDHDGDCYPPEVNNRF